MLTKKKLLEHKAALEVERDTMLNNLNAVSGALQLIELLLKECDAEDEEDRPKG
jgi:hypothetical protein